MLNGAGAWILSRNQTNRFGHIDGVFAEAGRKSTKKKIRIPKIRDIMNRIIEVIEGKLMT